MVTQKYARMEYERRFVVDPGSSWQRCVKPWSKLLSDRYLDCGRLRVRRMEDSDTDLVTFKVTKKFGADSMFAQPIVSVGLSPAEYEALMTLPGLSLIKRRYYDESDGRVFSIDVFQDKMAGLILCETEAESLESLLAARFPEFARWEVTEDRLFTGGSLCRAEWPQVEAAITEYRNYGRRISAIAGNQAPRGR